MDYSSKKWQDKRIEILKRDHFKCRECKRYGRNKKASTVHHIIPIEDNPGLKYSNINMISLCNKCHEKMHDRKTNELTTIGQRWVDRIAPLVDSEFT